ncbi:RsmD family RNA methyltransferase [Spirochaeta lutea]|uniref:Methyltransferase n=1 Tax=Spirochaeta lutea TaxID=1480694 RepID=A0A098QV75_9SPIO|nr:RsmD family RNA methyltransferase [Spirochaeta lutea]KGE71466.1 methyltransferase [Spirochaeta lutea]
MRITGGIYRGRTVTCPPGIIRPAMDRMRESVFTILGSVQGLSFLDLFTGSGIIALEAASRGAEPVYAVEKDPGKKTILKKNLSIADQNVHLSIMPAERFVKTWKKPFDLVFLDPPFPYPFKADLLARVAASRLVHPSTQIIIHYPGEETLPDNLAIPRLEGQSSLPRFFQDDSHVSGNSTSPQNTSWTLTHTDTREFGRSLVRFYKPRAHTP